MKKSQAADDDDEDLNDTNYDEVTGAPWPVSRRAAQLQQCALGICDEWLGVAGALMSATRGIVPAVRGM